MLQNPTLTKNTCYLQLTKNATSDKISVNKFMSFDRFSVGLDWIQWLDS